ncbi:MAG: hypothetical protein JXR51_10265 [Bacteroidales bacterium]|nr:hypothetical protein [Bacteroidales bacterium]MBN2757550.1 hypothetical protein [Bacteroidales bacterium]
MNKLKLLSLAKTMLLATAFSILIVSCGNNETENQDETVQDTVAMVTEQAKKLIYPLPTPLEVTKMLIKAGASYILDISNSTENADKYFTEAGKALNLGVYGADLSYASTYNKTQETTNYFVCTKKLLDGLNVQTPFNEELAEKIEKNIDNAEVLHEILTTSFHDTFEFLNENGKGAVSVMILSGGWIESLYLSTELATLTDNNKEIIAGIAQQKSALKTLVSLLKTYESSENVSGILSDLKDIEMIFSEVNEIDGKLQLTEEQFNNISSEIKSLRKKVVETH